MNTGVSRSKIFGVGEYPSGTFRFKKIDGSFWNGETFRFADYKYEIVIRRMELILKPEYMNAAVKIVKTEPYSFTDLIIKAMDYKGVRENIFPDYVRNDVLGIKTCIYCNAQFAITAETEPALTPAMIKKTW